jgi:hypothetical protein
MEQGFPGFESQRSPFHAFAETIVSGLDMVSLIHQSDTHPIEGSHDGHQRRPPITPRRIGDAGM